MVIYWFIAMNVNLMMVVENVKVCFINGQANHIHTLMGACAGRFNLKKNYLKVCSMELVCCLIAILIFFLYRNTKVLYFREMIIDMCASYGRRHDFSLDAYDWFEKKHSYNDMLFSFKPLKLEAWFAEEELTKINS